jgi:uncharacterized protein (DUF433 family)
MNVTQTSQNSLPIHSDPEIMSGVPVFIGTRVPVRTLFDYLIDGSSVAEFLDNFPSVKKDQVERLLEIASGRVLEGIDLHENTH